MRSAAESWWIQSLHGPPADCPYNRLALSHQPDAVFTTTIPYGRPARFRRAARKPTYRVSTGEPGLDVILGGGLNAERVYLVESTSDYA
jgi:hypothetical protein